MVATAYHPQAPRTPDELETSPELHGQIIEWAVAQELFRRQCLVGKDPIPEDLSFWQSKTHEIDFVASFPKEWIEVKRGPKNPFYYQWFLNTHPKGYLTIINASRFETNRICGITLEDFLLEQF